MFQSIGIAVDWSGLQLWIAQVPVAPGVATPEQAALVFSGPKFFVALVAGVLLSFAIQMLLTNLSVAAGISYLGHQPSGDSGSSDESGSLGGTIRKIGTAVGLWTLITVTITLFVACFLAVRLSLVFSPWIGAIVGLVIWAAYFSLLVWLSSTTLSSLIGLVGSVINTATSGLQSLLGTAASAITGRSVNHQVVSTAEAAAAAVRRELSSAVDPGNIRDTIEDYIDKLRPPEMDLSNIRREFEKLLNDPDLRSLAGSDNLQNITRDTFVSLVSSRSDFSKRDINRIADQLYRTWNQVIGQGGQQRDQISELREFLESALPDELSAANLNNKFDQLVDALRHQGGGQGGQSQQNQQKDSGLVDRAVQFGLTTLMGSVLSRTDLSDISVEQVLEQLQQLRHRLTQSAQQATHQLPGQPFNTIRADVENYILNSYPWHFNRETIRQEFTEAIYDPDADPGMVRRQLEPLGRPVFIELLTQRGDLTPGRVTAIADQMESVRQEVLSTVRTREDQETTQDLRTRIADYLRSTTKTDLTPAGIERDFKSLLEDAEADATVLENRLRQFDRETLVQLLKQRTDLTPEESAQVLVLLETNRDRVLQEAQTLGEQAQAQANAVQLRVENYLRNTGKEELNPEGIERELGLLLQDPQAGLSALQSRLSHFDRETWVSLLSQRPDLSPAEANQIVDQVERNWYRVTHAPQAAVERVKDQYDDITTAIADYLRSTNLEELNPQGIQQDLSTLLHDPRAGTVALRRRLSQVDRETLVTLLSQRGDLTEDQINQTIDQVQSAIRQLARAPRRLATRTQRQVRDIQASIEDYLRNTEKAELNPDGIKRDLQLLVQSPRVGLDHWRYRLSHFDRDTLVALLAQRQDMTEAEANRTVDQILSVRDQMLQQVQNVQQRIQSVIDGIFARIRLYLNSLERPELNYEGIRQDLRTLFNDPQAGFDALRDRLGHFNRDTLVALLSSRDDISEADVNRILDQIEGARTNVLQRAERMQRDAQQRLEEVKLQAQRQAEETRKAAATAAWWLFATALTSGVASALAGALAVPALVAPLL